MGYYVKPIVCDYGVFHDWDNKLCLVCNRKSNAELILKILEVDNGDDAEHHHDKVCRDYEPDCTRKPLERILERLDTERKKPETCIYQFEAYNKAIEIVKEEM